jgi:quercetin dioxygenase-like cupin family protein
MNLPSELILCAAGEGPAFSAVGDVYRILASGEQTGDAYALLEANVLPGGGPPPHVHSREDEAFYVLEGEMTFFLADKKVTARPGAFVQVPRGTPHAFKNEGKSAARMLIQITPAGFDLFLREFAHPLPSFASAPLPVTPGDIQKLLALAPKYGITILPPQ